MSTIPPNWLGSIIQSQGAQERATHAKSAEQAKGTDRAAFSEELQDIIENNDRDGEVFADAEGTGSQGSPFSEPDEDLQDQADEETNASGDSSAPGLDIEA